MDPEHQLDTIGDPDSEADGSEELADVPSPGEEGELESPDAADTSEEEWDG